MTTIKSRIGKLETTFEGQGEVTHAEWVQRTWDKTLDDPDFIARWERSALRQLVIDSIQRNRKPSGRDFGDAGPRISSQRLSLNGAKIHVVGNSR